MSTKTVALGRFEEAQATEIKDTLNTFKDYNNQRGLTNKEVNELLAKLLIANCNQVMTCDEDTTAITTTNNTLANLNESVDIALREKFESEQLLEVHENSVTLFRISSKISLFSEPEKAIELVKCAVKIAIDENKPLILAPFGGKSKVATILFRYPKQSDDIMKQLRPLTRRNLLFVAEGARKQAMSYIDLKQLSFEGQRITMTENLDVLVSAFDSTRQMKDDRRKSLITLYLTHAFGVNDMSPEYAFQSVQFNVESPISFEYIFTASAINRIRSKAEWFYLEEEEIDYVIENIQTFVEYFREGQAPEVKDICPQCGK